MEDHSVQSTLINIIIKEAFRQSNLKQIGKIPRFFDPSKALEVEGTGLLIMPGFRASAFNYEQGLAIVIDNVNKFITTKSCLERMHEIGDITDPAVQEMIHTEFKYSSVIANWGNKKAYIVKNVLFNTNPFVHTFKDNEGNVHSIAEYYKKTYNMKISEKNQPLFEVHIGGKECHLPPEFCMIDGVPQTIRSNPQLMREVLSTTRRNPEQKLHEIQEFSRKLFDQKSLRDWGIEIEMQPVSMKTQVLPLPKVEMPDGSQGSCDQNTLRRMPPRAPIQLEKGRWIMAYDASKNFESADRVY